MPHDELAVARGRNTAVKAVQEGVEPALPEPKKVCVIYDLDNTLTEAGWRLPYITGEQKDWETFFTKAIYDEPNTPIMMLARSTEAIRSIYLSEQEEQALYDIHNVILTGRPETYRKPAQMWLDYYGVPYSQLYMRPDGDRRADYRMKENMLQREILSDYDRVLLAVDDRETVVSMFRKNNIMALQCRDGDILEPKEEEKEQESDTTK